MGATGRPQPLCHQELDITVSTCRVLNYYRGIVCPWGGANTGISRPDSIMASGLGGRERVDL